MIKNSQIFGVGPAKVIYFGMRIMVLLASLFFLVRESWDSALVAFLILLLMMAPSFLKERYKIHLPFPLDFSLVAFIFLTLFLGEVARFYDYFPLWDKFLHFQSGLLLGACGYIVVYMLNEYKKEELHLKPIFLATFGITFSLALGAVWEIFEFTIDNIFHLLWQPDLSDTMWDLIADGSGGVIISAISYFWMKAYRRLPFTPCLLRNITETLIDPKKMSLPPASEALTM